MCYQGAKIRPLFTFPICGTGLLLDITETNTRIHAKLTQTSKEGLPDTKEGPSGGNRECQKTIVTVSWLIIGHQNYS